MAEVNIYSYVTISIPGSERIVFGSKSTSSTITLTGTGEFRRAVYNDLANGSTTALYGGTKGNMTGVKAWGVKSSGAGMLIFGDDASSGSAVSLAAGVWQWFATGTTSTSGSSTFSTRASGGTSTIDDVSFYNSSGAVADVEAVFVY